MFKLAQIAAFSVSVSAALTCNGTFREISGWEFSAGLNPGWNAGNTLDAMPTETSWGQPLLTNQTFTNCKQRGFNGVRIPVTWADHFISDAPDYNIDPAWLQRVSEVVDYAISNDLYAIVNAHHDSWSWLNPDAAGFNHTATVDKFYRLWYQVGTMLGCKSSKLAFETLNEPSGNTSSQADGDFLNTLHATMIRAIADAGGFNKDRVVLFCGLSDGYTTAIQYLQLPSNMTNPWILTWHMYGPWAFTAAAFGETLWGSESDKEDMWNNIHWARTNYTDVPIIIGEFGIGTAQTETAARWKYYDFVVNAARNSTESVCLWDASGTFAPNTTTPYGDPTAMDIIIYAARGVENALADSTEDANAPTYWSSAQLFQKLGDPIDDTNLPMLFNSKKLVSISCSDGPCEPSLRSGIDYTTNNQNVTFTKAFMSKLFPASAVPGLRANMIFHFDQGAADLHIPAYLWSTPSLAYTNITITNTTAQNDLWIPFTYRGMPEVAMVTAQMGNGTSLVDSWTMWEGPMIKGTAIYSYDWNYNSTAVAVLAGDLQDVIAAGIPTNFTFECYPRTGTGDNNAVLTVIPSV